MSFADESALVGTLREVGDRLSAALEHSHVVTDVRRVATRVRAAADHSTVLGAFDGGGRSLGRWIRSSWLYRWLTAEPDPEVIVVDLRETYTVGPIIAGLDRGLAWAGPRWHGSRPQRALASGLDAGVDAPVRVAGWIATVALLVLQAIRLGQGGGVSGPLVVALGIALLATRERRPAPELRETLPGRALEALLGPPEPPESEENRDESREK